MFSNSGFASLNLERVELIVAPENHHLELLAPIAPPLLRETAEDSVETLQQPPAGDAEVGLAPLVLYRNDTDRSSDGGRVDRTDFFSCAGLRCTKVAAVSAMSWLQR